MTQNSDKFEVLKFNELSISEMQNRAQSFLARMSTRRTVRNFSDRSVPKEISYCMKEVIKTYVYFAHFVSPFCFS